MQRCDNDPHVVAAIAALFWHDRKVDKARTWFNRCVTVAPDHGDFWAAYLKFELQHGTAEQQAEVTRRCVAAEPRHGEKWTAVSKRPENIHLKTEQVLNVVVVEIDRATAVSGARAASAATAAMPPPALPKK